MPPQGTELVGKSSEKTTAVAIGGATGGATGGELEQIAAELRANLSPAECQQLAVLLCEFKGTDVASTATEFAV